jgi:hypothetical protein
MFVHVVVLAHSPEKDYASLLRLSLTMAALGGCVTYGLGMADLSVVSTYFGITPSLHSSGWMLMH